MKNFNINEKVQYKYNNFKKTILIDFFHMSILFILSLYFVYFQGGLIRDIFFILPLFFFWRSKKNYFWFAYFFILINAPAYLFANQFLAAQFRLPLYNILPSMSFTIFDLFAIIALIKAFRKGSRKKIIINKPLKYLLIYFIFFSIPLSFIIGTDLPTFANTFRAIFFYSVMISFLWLLNDKEETYLLGYLIIPYLFLIVYAQIYLLLNGRQFITLFDPGFAAIARNSVTGDVRVVVSGILIVYYAMFFGYQLMLNRKYAIYNRIGEILVIISGLSLFLSATRVWISITLLCLLIYQISLKQKIKAFFSISILSILIIFILNTVGIISLDYFERNIWGRYFPTVEALAKGEFNKTDTFTDRITNDIPNVIQGVKVSPIIGVGLSETYREHYSNDIGFYNTILLLGGLGTILFFYFIFNFLKKTSISSYDELIPFKIIWSGILLGYFFTWDFFSFYPSKVFFISIILASAELIMNNKKEVQKEINIKKKKLAGVLQ